MEVDQHHQQIAFGPAAGPQAPAPAPAVQVENAVAVVGQDHLLIPELLRHVAKYLSFKDFKNCREMSRGWNTFVLRSERFQSVSKGKLSEAVYRIIQLVNLDATFRWTKLQLTHFQYHRHSLTMKNYWHMAVSETLTKLSLCKCAFECDGFIFLLSHCANLDTLILNGCKLRDLDDLHSEAGRPRVGVPCNFEPAPNPKPLQHLVIENMFKFEQCFMDYIIIRTLGQLKSFKISKCFLPDCVDHEVLTAKAGRPSLLVMYEEFQRNIIRILNANRGQLEKFSYDQNGYQMSFFHALSSDAYSDLLQVPELKLSLTIADPQNGYFPFLQFMQKPHPTVRKLTLQIMGFIAHECFNQAIESFKPTLEDFTFIFNGNNLSVAQPLDVSSEQSFENFKRLVFRDNKSLRERDVRCPFSPWRSQASTKKSGYSPSVVIKFGHQHFQQFSICTTFN